MIVTPAFTLPGVTVSPVRTYCAVSVLVRLPSGADIVPNSPELLGGSPFSIDLDCGAGASNVNVKYTLSDISSPTNTSSTLGLANVPDSASSFAIQVLGNFLSVSFGPDSSIIGTINQGNFGKLTSTDGRLGKSLVVRYLRTSTLFVTGKVKAGMTMTKSYQ